jgi:hypothetical protein
MVSLRVRKLVVTGSPRAYRAWPLAWTGRQVRQDDRRAGGGPPGLPAARARGLGRQGPAQRPQRRRPQVPVLPAPDHPRGRAQRGIRHRQVRGLRAAVHGMTSPGAAGSLARARMQHRLSCRPGSTQLTVGLQSTAKEGTPTILWHEPGQRAGADLSRQRPDRAPAPQPGRGRRAGADQPPGAPGSRRRSHVPGCRQMPDHLHFQAARTGVAQRRSRSGPSM